MAKQPKQTTSTGEAKTPLIVALVICVLLMLTFGVLAYMFNSDLATAKEAEKKALADAKSAQDQLAKEREAKLIYKAALGITNEEDRTDLQGIRFKEDARTVHANMMAEINNRIQAAVNATASQFVTGTRPNIPEGSLFRWDWPQGGDLAPTPTKSLIDVAVTNFSQRQLAENKYNVEAASLAQAQKSLQELSVKLDNAQKLFDEETKKLPEQVAKGIQEVRAQFEEFKADFKQTMEQSRERIQQQEEELTARGIDLRRRTEQIERLTTSLEQQQQQLEAQIDPFQFDKPQGRIIRRTDGIVEIDLGSADNLRQGLTFSVMPMDTPQRGFERRMRQVRMNDGTIAQRIVPKGSIEVIEVVAPNLARARITEEDNPVRDRIMTGDLLYNPVWRRGASEHVVLYGIFDLNGDGRDDIKELRDNLARMGVVVDAYYDLSTMRWVGNITSRTTFAIEGYTPTITLGDGNVEGKGRIISAIQDARKEVKDMGIRVLRPREFFPRIGYTARLDIPESLVNQAAMLYLRNYQQDDSGGGLDRNGR
jgi:hypothetical protein